MRGIPGDLTTATRPPTTVPLRHFLVALAFLVAGGALALHRVAGALLFVGNMIATVPRHGGAAMLGWNESERTAEASEAADR